MGKLVLSRRIGERIRIRLDGGKVIHVGLEGRRGNAVRISIDAPMAVSILRDELEDRPAEPTKEGTP